MTPEQKSEIARQNGQKGGRPPGSGSVLPLASMDALQSMKFRVKADYKENPAACEIAGLGMAAIVRVMMGKIYSRKAPSVLKAAIAARAEICEPVVTESKVKLDGLSAALAETGKRIADKKEE
jgi:hypothetical protein